MLKNSVLSVTFRLKGSPAAAAVDVVCPSVCLCVLTINNICAVEMDPLHLEVRPYIQS